MTDSELILCLSSVFCSSISQLFIKSASVRPSLVQSVLPLVAGGALQLGSVLLAVIALRTMQLSQLVPFAAAAHLLVPIGGQLVFKERLFPRFWLGATLIVTGIIIIYS